MAPRDKEYLVEGRVLINFELRCDTAKMAGYDFEDGYDDFEEFIADAISDDPAEFFSNRQGGVNVLDFSAETQIDSCREQEPDWSEVLAKLLVEKNLAGISDALHALELANSTKKKLVQLLTKGDADEDDE